MEAMDEVVANHRALLDHLAVCPDCRTEEIELTQIAGALALIAPGAPEEWGHPGEAMSGDGRTGSLDAAVARVLSASEDLSEPRRALSRRRVVAAALAMAAVAIVVVGAVSLAGNGTNRSRTVALVGPSEGQATAVLTQEAWGTSITLTDSTTRPNQVLTVSMKTEYGRLWPAGSYHVTGTTGVRITLACALPLGQIQSISVTDATGQVVLAST